MGKLSKLFRKDSPPIEQRARVDDPQYWHEFFTKVGLISKSGQNITPDSALQSTTVYACVRVLAETIASLPLMIYRRRSDGGKEPAQEHSLYFLLHDMPNHEQSSFEFREMTVGHLCLRGNAYIYIERGNDGYIRNLWPLNPAKMQVKRIADRIIYEYAQPDGKIDSIPSEQIWHIRGLSTDGLMGLSPITLAREAIGLGLSAEEYGARFFTNDATPGGILEFPGSLKEETALKLKQSWQEAQTGDKRHTIAVLQQGLKWHQVGMNNEDAQFLQTRKYQVEDIARIFRVPCVLIGHPDNTSTYASAEQFFLSFVVHTVRPWLVRIEQSIQRSLFIERDRKQYFPQFKLEGLLRGDITSRFSAYATGRQWGWLSINDIRELENMNPIPIGGDDYLQPLNFVPIQQRKYEEMIEELMRTVKGE